MQLLRKSGMWLVFAGLALSGCDALTGERYPVPEGTYEVPQTEQLTRRTEYFNDAEVQEKNLMRMRDAIPYNWKE